MSPSSGSGVGTPIGAGAPFGTSTAEPIPYTLLSLSRYAQIMGINPLHFMRGATPGLNPVVMPDGGCSNMWFKYDWQNNDQVSWMQIANEIMAAEQEIANLIGYWPAPKWIVNEQHPYPRIHKRELYGVGFDVRTQWKSINAYYGKIISVGRRAVTLVGTATTAAASLIYSDEDSDGYYETATIRMATTVTDPCTIKLYYAGHSGDQDWEVRPLRTKAIAAGMLEITLGAWLLIEPELFEDYPTSNGIASIDVSTTANYVTSVDVYYEYADAVSAQAVFTWEDQDANPQNGSLGVRDEFDNIVVPRPGAYDATLGYWVDAAWGECYGREPDNVCLWYLAGERDQRFLKGISCEPLPLFWAQIIAWLVTARLERDFCDCGNVQAVAEDLRIDITHTNRESSHFVTGDVMDCPFGTRKGEVMAWRRIKRLVKDRRFGVAVI